MKSRPLRYPSASRTTTPFTAVSLYPNSNLPLQITLRAHEHNSGPTMKVTTDKETAHTDKHTRRETNTRVKKRVGRVKPRNPSSCGVAK